MPVLSLESITSTFDALQREAEGLKTLTTLADVKGTVVELKEKILAARESQLATLKEIDELKRKVMEVEDWEAQKKRYEPMQFEPGVTVYALKNNMAPGEPVHHACPRCFQKKEISILQRTAKTSYGRYVHFCPACNTELAYGQMAPQRPNPRVITDYNPFDQ
jgi:hypothetical protein